MTRRHARSGSPYETQFGFSRAVRVGDRIVVAGTAPIPATGEPLAETAFEQMMRCGEIALAAVADLGGAARHVVRTRMFLTDADDAGEVGRAHQRLFGEAGPAATMVVVAGLIDPAWKVELELEAVVSLDGGGG